MGVEQRARNRWITQTKFYDPNQPPELCTGNCTEAALASLFGIQLDDVPSMQGMISNDYWDALEAFVGSQGYSLSMQTGNYRPKGLYLADGPSVRGCGHFVVMRDGEMVHDPHPSRAGLLRVDRVWVLLPLDPAALTPHEGHVVVTRNEAGQAVAVTRQDDEGRILSVIAEFESPKGDMGNPISVPEGYVLVPVEPTSAMQDAVESMKLPHALLRTGVRLADFRERYAAMLAACPEVKP